MVLKILFDGNQTARRKIYKLCDGRRRLNHPDIFKFSYQSHQRLSKFEPIHKMGAFISTAASNSASKPCTTSTTSHLATSTSLPVLVIKTSSVATTTSSVAVKTSSTSTTTSSAPTSTSTFYLKSSCDYSCLGHYAADDQVYSNVFSSNSTDVSPVHRFR